MKTFAKLFLNAAFTSAVIFMMTLLFMCFTNAHELSEMMQKFIYLNFCISLLLTVLFFKLHSRFDR